MPRGFGVYKRARGNGSGEDPVGDIKYNGGYVNDKHVKSLKRLGRVTLKKIAREGVESLYDRWQRMGLYGRQTGYFSFAKDGAAVAQDGTTASMTNWVNCPAFLWDLTCSRNSFSANEYVPNVAYQMIRNTSSGLIGWNYLKGQVISTGVDATDKSGASYQYYGTPRASSLFDHPFDNAILDWAKIQMVFYGSKKTSHKIWVEVCQLDPELQPKAQTLNLGSLAADALSSTPGALGQDEQAQTIDGQQMWTNELARLVDGPFATFSAKCKKLRYKVLHKRTLEFTPVASYEEAGSALVHKQTFNLFLKMGRRCHFAWRNDGAPGSSILGDTNLETDVERGMHSTYCHPNARIFLLVKTQVFNKVGDDAAFAADSDCAPSFDIRISRKWLTS